ncbi:MAG: hypothetical protein KTR31_07380 [Myxococcales bacterium]|nr:hypothetical protein [Myxococcales bacterium]
MRLLTAGPQLSRVPDGRRSPIPLVPSEGFIYTALMVGIVPVAVVACGQAVLLRRLGAALGALAIGMVGFVSPLVLLTVVLAAGLPTDNLPVVVLVVRLVSVALGVMLHRILQPHVRGHRLLEGPMISLAYVILPAFAWIFAAPRELQILVELPVLSLLGGA